MGRKKNNTSGADVDVKQSTPLAQRLSTLITDTNELKEYLGCSIQAINQYKLGISRPSLENLCKIADFYGVSTDYLLGRTETRSPNATIQAVCDYTGLSERAVSALRSLYNECQTHKTPPFSDKVAELAKFGRIPNEIDMLNYLISNLRFQGVLSDLVEVGQCSVMLRFPMELLDEKQELMLRNFPDGYKLISPFEYSRLARYELSTDFERMVDFFISEIQDY